MTLLSHLISIFLVVGMSQHVVPDEVALPADSQPLSGVDVNLMLQYFGVHHLWVPSRCGPSARTCRGRRSVQPHCVVPRGKRSALLRLMLPDQYSYRFCWNVVFQSNHSLLHQRLLKTAVLPVHSIQVEVTGVQRHRKVFMKYPIPRCKPRYFVLHFTDWLQLLVESCFGANCCR